MNEVSTTFSNYFSDPSNTVHYHGDGKLVNRFADALINGKVKEFEAPDCFIKYEHEVWIIEHFEFDCYKAGRKGSTLERELKRIERAEKDVTTSNKKVSVFHETVNAQSSYNDYCANVIKSFNNHYEKIDQYKKNLISHGYATKDSKFIVMFIIDDVSTLGSSYVDVDSVWRPIVLAHSKNFLEVLKNSPNVDCVLSFTRKDKYRWFIDRTCIDEYYKNVEEYESGKFVELKPMVFKFQIEIPVN